MEIKKEFSNTLHYSNMYNLQLRIPERPKEQEWRERGLACSHTYSQIPLKSQAAHIPVQWLSKTTYSFEGWEPPDNYFTDFHWQLHTTQTRIAQFKITARPNRKPQNLPFSTNLLEHWVG